MAYQVVHGAMTSCTFGTCAARLKILPFKLPTLSLEAMVPFPQFGIHANFDAAGNLLSQVNFEAGLMHGESLVYGAGGVIAQKFHYVQGVLQGGAEIYANGNLMSRFSFHKGKLEGAFQCFSEGVMTASMSFAGGVRAGASRFYNAHGQLIMEANFTEGLESGMRTMYDAATGAVLNAQMYVNGRIEGAMPVVILPTPEVNFEFNMEIGGAFAFSKPAAQIRAHIPLVNIGPFCLCSSPINPAVAAATAAAGGVLTPVPCVPKTDSPWIPGSPKVTTAHNAALNDSSILICANGGVISVDDPGQKVVSIP